MASGNVGPVDALKASKLAVARNAAHKLIASEAKALLEACAVPCVTCTPPGEGNDNGDAAIMNDAGGKKAGRMPEAPPRRPTGQPTAAPRSTTARIRER